MKLKLCIHVHDISLYINCVFYCHRPCAFVAMATLSFHRLIMGKVETVIYFCLLQMFWKKFYRNVSGVVLYQPYEFWGARWLSGRVSDSGARGPGFETYLRRVCPWARHFTPRKYWLITQEAMAPSRHDWKIVDRDVKPQHNQPTIWILSKSLILIGCHGNQKAKFLKIFWEAIRGMKLKLCINVHDISLYIKYNFYCCCQCAFIAMAT